MKEPKEYKSFVYFYEGMPTKEDVANQATNQQKVSMTTESHSMNVELHLHSDIKL